MLFDPKDENLMIAKNTFLKTSMKFFRSLYFSFQLIEVGNIPHNPVTRTNVT